MAVIRERPETFFRLSPVADGKAQCFAVRRGEMSGRLDVAFNDPTLWRGHKTCFPLKALRELIADSFSGGTPSTSNPEYWNGNIPWVSPKDFGNFDIDNSKDHLSELGLKAARLNLAAPGSVLIVVRSGILKHSIPVAINSRSLAVNQDVKVYVTRSICEPRYLAWYLYVFQARLLPLVTKHSTTVQSINTREFDSLMIPTPPADRQANLVMVMDEARANWRAMLAAADKLLSSLDSFLLDMLGLVPLPKREQKAFAVKYRQLQNRFDPKTFLYRKHVSTKQFPFRSLGSLTTTEPDYGSGARAVERTSENQPKYIRITDFQEDGIPLGHEFVAAETIEEGCTLEDENILFARSGATAGKTFIYTKDLGVAVFAGYCIRFRFNRNLALPRFIYYFTKTSAYRDWVATIQRPSGQPNINKEEFKSLEIPIPPLNIQRQIVERLDAERRKVNILRAEAEIRWKLAKLWFEEQLLGASR